MIDPEKKLLELNITLPEPAKALGHYQPVCQTGNLLFVSGTLPLDRSGKIVSGRVGAELSIEQGKEAARLAACSALAAIKKHLGNLNRVERVVRAVGHISGTPDFQDHAQVMDGASELLGTLFGERGKHARLSLGSASLPKNAAIELELILQVEA